MELGLKIKKVRELRNFTQEYMAEKLHMSQPGYSKIETDEVDVNYQRLQQIAGILDIKLLDLVGFDEKTVINNYSPNQANQGYNVIHQTSDNEKKLYEDKIGLLEDKIKYLEETCGPAANGCLAYFSAGYPARSAKKPVIILGLIILSP